MPESLLQAILGLLHRIESPVIAHSDAAGFEDELKRMVEQRLLIVTSNASEIRRPERFGPGLDLVVRETPSKIYGVVPDEDYYYEPLVLSEDDIRQYEINVPALVDIIRKDNGISGCDFRNDGGLIPLGEKATPDGDVYDVYLSLPNDYEESVLARCRRLDGAGGTRSSSLPSPWRSPAKRGGFWTAAG